MKAGIELSLRVLTETAWRSRSSRGVGRFARALTYRETDRSKKVEAIVDFMHREFQFGPADPIEAEIIVGCEQLMRRETIDADDACLMLAAMAMSLGIRCRLIAARYGHSWTCWVEYEESEGSDRWTTVDPLREMPAREPDEKVTGLMPNEQKKE